MNYEVELNKQSSTKLIKKKYSYLYVLKYHIVLVLFPIIFVVVIFFSKLSMLVSYFYDIYYFIVGEEKVIGITIIMKVIRLLLFIFANGFIIALILQIFKTGIQFIPYLCLKNKLSTWHILSAGIKKFLPVLLLNWIAAFLMFVLFTLLMFLPVINLLSTILLPYCTALFVIYKEYMFTTNLMSGKPLLSKALHHFKYLYVENKQFLMYAGVLALSYYALLITAIFVKPFIQIKLIELFQPYLKQDKEVTSS